MLPVFHGGMLWARVTGSDRTVAGQAGAGLIKRILRVGSLKAHGPHN